MKNVTIDLSSIERRGGGGRYLQQIFWFSIRNSAKINLNETTDNIYN